MRKNTIPDFEQRPGAPLLKHGAPRPLRLSTRRTVAFGRQLPATSARAASTVGCRAATPAPLFYECLKSYWGTCAAQPHRLAASATSFRLGASKEVGLSLLGKLGLIL